MPPLDPAPIDKSNPLPLYLQVREHLRRQIQSGALPAGAALPFERDLAARLGVGLITVQHALAGLAAEGLIVRIKRKGTFVSPRLAAPPPAPRTLAFILPDIEDLFLSELYRGVAAAARQSRYRVSIFSSDRDTAQEAAHIAQLGQGGESGAVIFPNWGRTNAAELFSLQRRGFPFVLVNRFFRDLDADSVVADNRAGALAAVEHLISLGHRRIGCLGWLPSTAIEDRLDGYRLALGRHSIPYDERLVRSLLDEAPAACQGHEPAAGGYAEMRYLLSLPAPPTAVFAVSDRLVPGALGAAAEAGLRVPGDLSLVGFDDAPGSDALGLTTIAQPAFEMGRRAAALLVERLESSPAAPCRRLVLPVGLVCRRSSRAPAA
jgi:DNA-binding LacI/PurR family transcriptional regulator